jgi:hypothetical protein
MFARASILLALSLSACAASDAAPTPTAPSAAAPQTAAPDLCVPVMQRARACTAQWIPALVDARAQLDAPAGIKAAVAADRAGVIAEANTEWANDSKDAGIQLACARISASETAADRADSTRCLAKASCDDFVACEMPVVARHLAHP